MPLPDVEDLRQRVAGFRECEQHWRSTVPGMPDNETRWIAVDIADTLSRLAAQMQRLIGELQSRENPESDPSPSG
jgi:hypothetical protein